MMQETNPTLKFGFVTKKRRQYLAAIVASIGFFGMCTVVAWSSPALPKLSMDPQFNLTGEQKSWLAAFVPLGAMFGGPLGGYGIERYGRQRTLLMCALPFTMGWIMVALAHSTMMMNFGRFLTGICCGVVTLVVPIYVSEFTEETIRGLASSSMAVLGASGLLVTNVIGTFVSWQALTFLGAIVPVVYAAGLFYLPESPVYLLSKRKKKRATRALMWFRGTEYKDQVEPELVLMRAACACTLDKKAPRSRPRRLKLAEYLAPDILKATSVCMVLMFLQQFSGINAVVFYAVTIFQAAASADGEGDAEVGSESVSPNLASIIVSTVFVIGVLLFTFLVERIGRRPLLLLSEGMTAISLSCIGYFFYAKARADPIVPFISWLPLVSLVVFAIAFNIGYGPLPWLLMAELIPPQVKGLTSSAATAFNWALAFAVTKLFQDMNTALGPHGTYWLFAGVSAFGILFTYLCLPETRGKRLEDIQQFFRSAGAAAGERKVTTPV